MRLRRSIVVALLAVVGGSCSNLFAPGRPDGFAGWFHLDRGPDRAASILFDDGALFRLRDLGCTNPEVLDLTWENSGASAIIVPNLGPGTFFNSDGQGNLVASPAVFTADGGVETWTPGARCVQCGVDAGVFACDLPSVQDAGP